MQVYADINVDVVMSNGVFFVSYLWQHIIPVWQVLLKKIFKEKGRQTEQQAQTLGASR